MNKKISGLIYVILLIIAMIMYGFSMFVFGADNTIEEMKVNVDGSKVIITVYGEEYIHEIEAE